MKIIICASGLPPISDVITQKYLLEELRTPKNQKPRLHIFGRGSAGFLPDYIISTYIRYHAGFTRHSGALLTHSLGMQEVPGSNTGNDFKFK